MPVAWAINTRKMKRCNMRFKITNIKYYDREVLESIFSGRNHNETTQ